MRKSRRRRRVVVLVVVAAVLIGYGVWSRWDRPNTVGTVDARLKCVVEYGSDAGAGNLVAVQPYMRAGDYASRDSFVAKLDLYFERAAERGWLGKRTVVVLPEYLGAWLVVAGEKRGVYTARTTDSAMNLLVASDLFAVARWAVAAPCAERLRYGVFRSKAHSMARIYDDALSRLARKYRVTIVGGSITLPSPKVQGGRLRAGDGPLYNVSPVYLPNGSCAGLAVKAFLTADEKPWLKAGRVRDLPVFDTPAGRVGVLVCADAWYPSAYDVLKRKKADVVAAPSYSAGDHAWRKKWSGYSGQRPPADVRAGDIDTISVREAWMRYGFGGRMERSGIPNGVMASLRGRLWDLGADGSTVAVRNGKVTLAPIVDGGAIVNVWLPRAVVL